MSDNLTKDQEIIYRDPKSIKVFIARTSNKAQIPVYKTDLAAAVDVRSAGNYVIFPQQTLIVNTGLITAFYSPPAINIFMRSGISKDAPLRLANGVGVVEGDYRKEIGVLLTNSSLPLPGYETYEDYTALWHYCQDNSLENGNLTKKDLKCIRDEFSSYVHDLEEEDNLPGVYIIEEGQRIAQFCMGEHLIDWITEDFYTEEELDILRRDGCSEKEIFYLTEERREKHLKRVLAIPTNRKGGFGSTGID